MLLYKSFWVAAVAAATLVLAGPGAAQTRGKDAVVMAMALEPVGLDPTTAAAYSTGQQLITTAFNTGFAIILLCVVFGWGGGTKLVKDSYVEAKEKKEEMSEQRREKKEEKRQAREANSKGGAKR